MNDCQVDASESLSLRECFAEESVFSVQHTKRGHNFPADKRSMTAYRNFLLKQRGATRLDAAQC